jgi:hypothetical protein
MCRVAGHCVSQHTLVRFHFFRPGTTARYHFYILAFHVITLDHGGRANGYRHFRTDTKAHIVLHQGGFWNDRGRLAKAGEYLFAHYNLLGACCFLDGLFKVPAELEAHR